MAGRLRRLAWTRPLAYALCRSIILNPTSTSQKQSGLGSCEQTQDRLSACRISSHLLFQLYPANPRVGLDQGASILGDVLHQPVFKCLDMLRVHQRLPMRLVR